MQNDKNLKIKDAFTKVYTILKFKEKEAQGALNDLMWTQQMAITVELIRALSDDAILELNAAEQKSDEEKKAVMEKIAKAHAADEGFKNAARAAAKKVIDEHIAYLKTRGDEAQKAEIAKILAEIE